jgi:hypothetical protein
MLERHRRSSRRNLVRAFGIAALAVLVVAPTVLADTVPADADIVAPGDQPQVHLGTVPPGAVVITSVGFRLLCNGLWHADPGQTVEIAVGSTTIPAAGGSISATPTTIGPVPAGWADDSGGMTGCPSGLPALPSTAPSTVTVVAPPVEGTNYEFTIIFSRLLVPVGSADVQSLTSLSAATFLIDVRVGSSDTTPPAFEPAPADVEVVSGDPAGALVGYPTPTAVDDTDPAPAVACDPASGSLFAIGSTTVSCVATDAAGNEVAATFVVRVRLATGVWDDPLAQLGAISIGRTVPVKARATLDGVAVSSGSGSFALRSCGTDGEPLVVVAATWSPGPERWVGQLRSGSLATGCWRIELIVDGLALGARELMLR